MHFRFGAFEEAEAAVGLDGVTVAGLLRWSNVLNLISVERRLFEKFIEVIAVADR